MRRRSAPALIVALVVAAPQALAAPCAGFVDVDSAAGPTAPFCSDVEWIRNRGVTVGCTATAYCPFDPVLRLQMAAFMRRLGDTLFPSTCATGQVMKWNGTAWTCANDALGSGGAGGSVTSLHAGTGLAASPSPVAAAGTLSLLAGYRLPQSCASGQLAKSDGAGGWTCGADAVGAAAVTSVSSGAGLTGGPVTTSGTLAVDTAAIQARVVASCGAGSSVRAINADGTVACEADDGAGNAFLQGGNAFGASAVLGSNDDFALDLRANGRRALRFVDATNLYGRIPNVTAGAEQNAVARNCAGAANLNQCLTSDPVAGAAIRGGGTAADPNVVTDTFGTIGGGAGNLAGDDDGDGTGVSLTTIGGGYGNRATRNGDTWYLGVEPSVVRGGRLNVAVGFGVAGGGEGNVAVPYATTLLGLFFDSPNLQGGRNNAADGDVAILGGQGNAALGPGDAIAALESTIAGGAGNSLDVDEPSTNFGTAQGFTLGGFSNRVTGHLSLAAGALALANRSSCAVFSLWPPAGTPMNCLGSPSIFRIGAANGFAVDYGAQRGDGGGTRWLYVGGLDPGKTIVAWNGAYLSDGGAWTSVSDRDAKAGFRAVDVEDVLERVARLPVLRWHYATEGPDVRRLGPTAEDFSALFGLGATDRAIATVDAAGVALAAIQGLHARASRLREDIAALEARLDALLGDAAR